MLPTANDRAQKQHVRFFEGSGLLAWPWKVIVHRSVVDNCGWAVRDGGMDFAPLARMMQFTQVELFHLGACVRAYSVTLFV